MDEYDTSTGFDFITEDTAYTLLDLGSAPSPTPLSMATADSGSILSGLGNLLGGFGKAAAGVGSAITGAEQGAIYDASGRLVALGGKPVTSYSLLGGVTGGLSLGTILVIALVAWFLLRK